MAVIKAVNSKDSLGGIIKYITMGDKTEERLISGEDCSPSNVLEEMKVTKEIFNKTKGRQYKHFIQSFDPKDNLDYMKANSIGLEWAEKNFKGFEVLISTHKDKGHIHNHFIVNSVSFEDGRKLRYSNKELEHFKNINDCICEREGLNIVREPSKDITSFNHNKYKVIEKAFNGTGESYLLNTGLEVSNSLKVSKTKEEFIKSMEEKGYKVNWKDTRKYITFTTPEGKKIRNSNLQKTLKKNKFTKEGIENELRYNIEKGRNEAEELKYYNGRGNSNTKTEITRADVERKILYGRGANEISSIRNDKSISSSKENYRGNGREKQNISGAVEGRNTEEKSNYREIEQNHQRIKRRNEGTKGIKLSKDRESNGISKSATTSESRNNKGVKQTDIQSRLHRQIDLEGQSKAVCSTVRNISRDNSFSVRSISSDNLFDKIIKDVTTDIEKSLKEEQKSQLELKNKKASKLKNRCKDLDRER